MIPKLLKWIEHHQYLVLAVILIFAACTRFWRLDYPSTYYFDEVYHVVTAKLIAYGDPRAYEWWHAAPEPNTAIDWLHPPLAKLFQAASMILFGFTSFSWRFSSALFGVGVIALTFGVCKRLKLPAAVALLAAFLASTDGLLLTLSRVTMNDIFITFFYLLAVFLYLGWKEKPSFSKALWTAVAVGLAVSSKWSGIFVVGLIGVDLIWEGILPRAKKITVQAALTLIGLMILLVPTVYISSYGQMWMQGKSWYHFVQLHEQIWWYQNNLDATHPYQSTPLQWVFSLRPVYTFTENAGEGYLQNMYFQANPLLLWIGVATILFSVGTLAGSAALWIDASRKLWNAQAQDIVHLKQKLQKLLERIPEHQPQLIFLLLAYFSTWVVWLKAPRILFFNHYTPAIPFLCMIIASQLWFLRKRAPWGIPLVTLCVFFVFVLFYPNLVGLKIPADPWSSVFFALDSWR